MTTQTAVTYIILHKLIKLITEWEIALDMMQAEFDAMYDEMLHDIE